MPSMDRHLFAKKRVSLAVSMALGAVTAIPAVAQESESANDQVMELSLIHISEPTRPY